MKIDLVLNSDPKFRVKFTKLRFDFYINILCKKYLLMNFNKYSLNNFYDIKLSEIIDIFKSKKGLYSYIENISIEILLS